MSQRRSAGEDLEFELLAEIALGGTARVELCRVLSGRRKGELLAVKRLLSHVADDPQFVDMFRDEVWMTSALRHPNIVEVAGWGEDVQGLWLAVELVRGVSLQRLMKTVFETRERFTERMVVYTARCICDGLAAAHSLQSSAGEHLNVVHRDLTPGNILLGFNGEVKIADFGLAKAKQRITKTLTGLLKGKPQYMSPEQVQGDSLDGRSDLFALGVILFELFSSRRPWRAKTDLDAMRAITDERAEDLQQLAPKIDRALVEVVHRALEKDPALRYQTAVDLRHRLDEWLMAHGYREGNAESVARFVRRNAMRQMRWFERAAAGHMAEQARAEERVRVSSRTSFAIPAAIPDARASQPHALAAKGLAGLSEQPSAVDALDTLVDDDDSWPGDDDGGPTLIKRSQQAQQMIRQSLRKPRLPKRRGTRSSETFIEPSVRAARLGTDELPTVPGTLPPQDSVHAAKQAAAKARQNLLGDVAPADPTVPPPPTASTPGPAALSSLAVTTLRPATRGGVHRASPTASPNETITRVAAELAVAPVPVPAYPSFTGVAPPTDFSSDPAAQAQRMGEAAQLAADGAEVAAGRARAAGHAALLAGRASQAAVRGESAQARALLMQAVRIDLALQQGEIPDVPGATQAIRLGRSQPSAAALAALGGPAPARHSIPGTAVSGVHNMSPAARLPSASGFDAAVAQLLALMSRREGALLMAGLAFAMLVAVVLLAWLFS